MTRLKVPAIRKPLPVESILWIEGYNNYVTIHFLNGQRYTATRTLKWFEDQLPNFVRLRKGALVNFSHIIDVKRTRFREVEIYLRTGIKLPVARRRIKVVTEQLNAAPTSAVA